MNRSRIKFTSCILKIFIFLNIFFSFGQKQNNQWCLGSGGGINFNTIPPSFVSGLAISTVEGCASIADRNTGNLLFYTDGCNVWNSQNSLMPNGSGLLGGTTQLSSTTAAVIVPKIGSTSLFYIITIDEQFSNNGLRYSIVDMNLNGGLGDIVAGQKNIFLYQTTSEKLEVVPANDGQSFWLITHNNNDSFVTFKIDSSGIQTTPVTSVVGGNQGNGAGHLKINKQYNKLAVGNFFSSDIELFDFNNSSGVVSNAVTWNFNFSNTLIYGIEFSPDGNLLYVSNLEKLIQYDLTQTTPLAIENSAFEVSSGLYQAATLQLGMDNKIYINAGSIDAILCPNNLGANCSFQQNAIANQTTGGGYGLPKWVYYPEDLPYQTNNDIIFSGTCFGSSTAFLLENLNGISSIIWNFDDPTSGSNNSSNLFNPTHTFTNPGTYNVTATDNCGQIISKEVIITSIVLIFDPISTICSGITAPTLPTTSLNGIIGTWSPSVIDNTVNGVYTFTPNTGQCATSLSISTTVTNSITPTFNTVQPFCLGTTAPNLPTTSLNGIVGTWSPSVIDITNSETYTFTPNVGQCALSLSITTTVTNSLTPTFNLIPTICSGTTAPILPTTSLNGIVGTWSPSVIDNTSSGTYTFTPNVGQCASSLSITITVTNSITPTFNPFPSIVCTETTVPILPTTSLNGIFGTWSPSVIDYTSSGHYTFTPDVGQCATSLLITIVNSITPTFNPIPTFCSETTAPILPTTSLNGIVGTWSPSVVDNTISGTYTFIPNVGQCAVSPSITTNVVNPITPTFNPIQPFCLGTTAPILPLTSINGIIGTWSPPVISNTTSGTYIFTPNAGQCATNQSIDVLINQDNLNSLQWFVSEPFANNAIITLLAFNPGDYLYQLDFGLSQTSNVFQNVPSGLHTIKVIDPNGCSETLVIDDILIINYPKYFTPNGDGYNDTWNVSDLFIFDRNAKINIFDRYGKLLKQIIPFSDGWDGLYNGYELPATDYWFTVEYVFNNKRKLFKAHFSLKR